MARLRRTPPVELQAGRVTGVYETEGEVAGQVAGPIAVFRGIPYAQPPVKELRWTPPQPPTPWNGVLKADAFGPAPIQLETNYELFIHTLIERQGWGWIKQKLVKLLFELAPQPEQSEDCLYLNVRTPTLDTEARLPVMVWIHGGDHQDGSAAHVLYDSNALARHGVVVVSINYRLGLMGYLAHPQLSAESEHDVSGNYGTLDQIAALKWVQENVRCFGGDPDDVTIFGESAGGESVAHMMTSPLARGLFHKAIMQSPANGGQMRHLRRPFLAYRSAEQAGQTFADHFVPPGDDQLAPLRQIPAEDLYSLARTREFRVFYPVIDCYVLPKSPFEAFYDGEQAPVPLLLGSNADEGTLLYPLVKAPLLRLGAREVALKEIPDLIRQEFGEDAEALMELYPGLREGSQESAEALLGDSFIGAPVHFYARQAAEAAQPVFLYMFTRTPPTPGQTAGAYHAAELTFVHGTKIPLFDRMGGDEDLTQAMGDYWTHFARSGDPDACAHPHWPAFDPEEEVWMRLGPGEELGAEGVQRTERYAILEKRLLRHIEEMKRLHSRSRAIS